MAMTPSQRDTLARECCAENRNRLLAVMLAVLLAVAATPSHPKEPVR